MSCHQAEDRSRLRFRGTVKLDHATATYKKVDHVTNTLSQIYTSDHLADSLGKHTTEGPPERKHNLWPRVAAQTTKA